MFSHSYSVILLFQIILCKTVFHNKWLTHRLCYVSFKYILHFQVMELSNLNETVCRCENPPGPTLASTFYVPPNTIDFHAVWSKFDPANAAVYGTIIALLLLYFIVIPWFRRQDKKDIHRVRLFRENVSI